MTLSELKSGTEFKYSHSSYYTLKELDPNSWVVCQFGMYVATVDKMTEKYINVYTSLLGKIVKMRIEVSKCIDMEQERNRDYQIQEMVDEYGIGAYEE